MAESKFRYEVITTQGGLQVEPTFDFQEVNDPDFVITETREQDRFYYVKKVKSKLNLIKSDYDYIFSRFGNCYKYVVKVYKICEEGEKFLLQCYFSDINIEINKDKCSIDVELNVDSTYNCFKDKGSTKIDIGGPFPQNLFLELTPTKYRTLGLYEVIVFVNGQTLCCDDLTGQFVCYNEIISDFFNWQPSVLPDDQAMTNYVNPAQPNYYCRVAMKSDIKNPTASNPATKMQLSFNDIEDIMREVFNCYWVIEGIYLRWEHYSWFTRFMNYDATTATNFPFNEYRNQIKLDNAEFPTTELWEFMEANGIDFIGTPLTYDENCTNGETKQRGISYLTTDTDYIISNPASIENEGIVIIDCFKVNATPEWFVYSDIGQLSLALKKNVRLSNANLQYDLHRYGRLLLSGTMNNIFQNFISKEPNILQENIIVQNCCKDEHEKWKSSVRTEIGFGKIDEAEIDYTKEIIKFKLRHDSI